MIKTINLNGSETKVTELGGDNTEIFNNSSGTVYASKLPNITIGGDEVIAIPAGAIDGLYGTRGTVYLLGTGSVELRGVDRKITESRGQSVAGSVGVVQDYIDSKNSETLEIAKTYADVKDSEVLVSVKEYADSLNAELAGYVGYTDNDIYGLEVDFENNKFTRLAGAVGKTAGADFDSVNAYGGRRRCNLSDDGEVIAYYGDEGFKSDGSNGQVMVEQPKFYYRVVPLKTEKIDSANGYHLRKARYYISDTPKPGFKVHPAFVRNRVEVDQIYLSAFEGCVYDDSLGGYLLNDEQSADFDNDKLSSIAGAKPCSGQEQKLTRTNSRRLANNRGHGWEQSNIQSISATQLLFLTEYAMFNSQEAIGVGISGKPSSSERRNFSEKTGSTLALGNFSGAAKQSENIEYISYRGEENLWGNIQHWIDGLNENEAEDLQGNFWTVHISTDTFADENKSAESICTCFGYGYTSAFSYKAQFDWLFLPSEMNGNSSIPVGDKIWNASKGVRACNMRGMWNCGSEGGLFSTSFNYAVTSNAWDTGARLIYIPSK